MAGDSNLRPINRAGSSPALEYNIPTHSLTPFPHRSRVFSRCAVGLTGHTSMCTLGRSLSGIGSAWALVRWVMCCGRRSSSFGNVLTSIQAVLCLWSRSYNVSGLTVVVVVLFLILLLLWCLGSGWKKLSSESDCAVRGLRKTCDIHVASPIPSYKCRCDWVPHW